MTAAGVRPKSPAMIFVECPLVQQHLSLTVENKNAKGPVQLSLTVSFQLLHCPDRFILLVHQYHFLVYVKIRFHWDAFSQSFEAGSLHPPVPKSSPCDNSEF